MLHHRQFQFNDNTKPKSKTSLLPPLHTAKLEVPYLNKRINKRTIEFQLRDPNIKLEFILFEER